MWPFPKKQELAKPAPRSRYGGGGNLATSGAPSTSSFLWGWNPQLREPMFDVRESWVAATARAIDQIQNSGLIAGAVEQASTNMIGSGLVLNAKPDLKLFGGDAKSAETWSQDTERRFSEWGRDPWVCDLGARYTFGQCQDQAVRQYFATGEIVATMPTVRRGDHPIASKINVMPSMRLVQETVLGGPFRQVQGIVLGSNMEPTAYIFWDAANIFGDLRQTKVAARTSLGMPVVMHIFCGETGAMRGISPLTPCLKVTRQYDQVADATLTAVLLQTIFAATVESDTPTVDLMKALQSDDEQLDVADIEGGQPGQFNTLMGQRLEWYKNTKIDLANFGKVAHMFPGEELKFNGALHPSQYYGEFMKNLLREISRCLCLSYSSMANDYSEATYSSANQEAADLWGINEKRRAFFPGRLCQNVWERFLYEGIETGFIDFPGGFEAFIANRLAASNAIWRGPPRPMADPLKSAKAMQIARSERWSSRDELCSMWGGTDWQETARQIKSEQDEDEELELPPLPIVGGGGTSGQSAPDAEAEAEDGAGKESGSA